MDRLKMGPLHLNYFLGHWGWGVSIDEAYRKENDSLRNLHSFPNATAQHHPRLAVDKEIALLSFSISIASWY